MGAWVMQRSFRRGRGELTLPQLLHVLESIDTTVPVFFMSQGELVLKRPTAVHEPNQSESERGECVVW